MALYLLDSSALWRLLRDKSLSAAWADEIDSGLVGSCQPQRVEFRRSARSLDEFDSMTAMFDALHPDVGVPKSVWGWIDSAQFRMAARGTHNAVSLVDWLVGATAAHHGLVVLHDDHDFVAMAEACVDVQQRNIHARPEAAPIEPV